MFQETIVIPTKYEKKKEIRIIPLPISKYAKGSQAVESGTIPEITQNVIEYPEPINIAAFLEGVTITQQRIEFKHRALQNEVPENH